MAEPNMFIYKIQPVRPEMLTEGYTPGEEQIIAEHFSYLEELTKSGVVYLAGRTLTTDYSSFGIVIFGAHSEEVARQVMLNDPAVKTKVMRAELYPFNIALLGELHKS